MYSVEILDTSGNVQTIIKNLIPIDRDKNVLKYDDYLSNYGTCTFRVKTKDPAVSVNYLEPYKYHVRIKRAKGSVWYGVIVNNNQRTHNFIEVEARTLLFYLTKCEVAPSDTTVMTRVFKSGTMATALTTMFNEAKNRQDSPIGSWTLGTIDNLYKLNTTTAYTFTNTDFLELPYASVMDAFTLCGDITNSDFELTTSKVFNFKRRIGQNTQIAFKWGKYGNLKDYNSPVRGADRYNVLAGLGISTTGTLLRADKTDSSTISTYKRLWATKVFNNANTQDILNAITTEELRTKSSGVNLKTYDVNEDGFLLQLGDDFIVDIEDGIISERERRRLIGRQVLVNENGYETIRLITNIGDEKK